VLTHVGRMEELGQIEDFLGLCHKELGDLDQVGGWLRQAEPTNT
jgi:hypothetical protein